MAMDKIHWSVAGSIAIGTVLGVLWLADRVIDPDELEARAQELSAEHDELRGLIDALHALIGGMDKKHQQQMLSILLDQALGAVRYWESRPHFPDLSTTDRLMYEDKLQKVTVYRAKLVELGME